MIAQRKHRAPLVPKALVYLALTILPFLLAPASSGQPARSGQAAQYAGTWVRRINQRVFLVLKLQFNAGKLQGVLARPRHYSDVVGDGTIVTDPEVVTVPILTATVDDGILHFSTADPSGSGKPSDSTLVLWDNETAGLAFENHDFMPRWILKRTRHGETPVVSTAWPDREEHTFTPEVISVQQQLHAMVVEDQEADRPPYTQFEIVCVKNYPLVQDLFRKYGWLTVSKFGKQAASDFWLLSAHQADAHPQFAKEELAAMNRAVEADEASAANYALFYDNLARAEGKPQRWGTKTACENGKRRLYPVGDMAGLDRRRAEAYLAPEASYLSDFGPCQK